MASHIDIGEVNENARRQYMDAMAAFEAWESAQQKLEQVRGGMFWKETPSGSYLIRTSLSNSQKSLGPRTPETEAISDDFIQRKAALTSRIANDPHPLRVTDNEEDLWAVQVKNAGTLRSSSLFTCVIVSTNGHMARIRTVSPIAFCAFKRWMAAQPERDPMKKSRDSLQADMVEQVVHEFLPHLESDAELGSSSKASLEQ
jgi:hypothetical protein